MVFAGLSACRSGRQQPDDQDDHGDHAELDEHADQNDQNDQNDQIRVARMITGSDIREARNPAGHCHIVASPRAVSQHANVYPCICLCPCICLYACPCSSPASPAWYGSGRCQQSVAYKGSACSPDAGRRRWQRDKTSRCCRHQDCRHQDCRHQDCRPGRTHRTSPARCAGWPRRERTGEGRLRKWFQRWFRKNWSRKKKNCLTSAVQERCTHSAQHGKCSVRFP